MSACSSSCSGVIKFCSCISLNLSNSLVFASPISSGVDLGETKFDFMNSILLRISSVIFLGFSLPPSTVWYLPFRTPSIFLCSDLLFVSITNASISDMMFSILPSLASLTLLIKSSTSFFSYNSDGRVLRIKFLTSVLTFCRSIAPFLLSLKANLAFAIFTPIF